MHGIYPHSDDRHGGVRHIQRGIGRVGDGNVGEEAEAGPRSVDRRRFAVFRAEYKQRSGRCRYVGACESEDESRSSRDETPSANRDGFAG